MLLFQKCASVQEILSLLDWLRCYRIAGSFDERDLRAIRRTCQRGTAVAIMHARAMSDRFFGEWLLLHHPHRTDHALFHPDAARAAPELRRFACAMLLCSGTWDDAAWVQREFELAGHRAEYVSTYSHTIRARVELVKAQVAGTLPRLARLLRPQDLSSNAAALSAGQRFFVDLVDAQVLLREEASQGACAVAARWMPLFLTGPPGCGKSFALDYVMARQAACGCRVLHASPTGMLAARTATH